MDCRDRTDVAAGDIAGKGQHDAFFYDSQSERVLKLVEHPARNFQRCQKRSVDPSPGIPGLVRRFPQ